VVWIAASSQLSSSGPQLYWAMARVRSPGQHDVARSTSLGHAGSRTYLCRMARRVEED
jgi:hypothetical protein